MRLVAGPILGFRGQDIINNTWNIAVMIVIPYYNTVIKLELTLYTKQTEHHHRIIDA